MPTTVTVAPGDCCSSLAEKAGFSSYTAVYQDGANAALREARPNANMLVPGDQVSVPDRTPQELDAATGREHKFKVKATQVKLRIAVIDEEDKPVSGKPYRLEVGGQTIDGTLPKNGCIEQVIPASASAGTLTLDPDAAPPAPPEPAPPPEAPPESPDPPPYPPPIDAAVYKDKLDPAYVGNELLPVKFALAIGSLPSFNEVIGVQARLANLAFDCRGEAGDAGPGTTAAVKAYQLKYGGGDSGAPADIQDAIRDKHDKVP